MDLKIDKKEKINLKGIVKYVYKKMGKAILDYNMLQEDDKVLVAVSGGPDSLSLAKLFQLRKRRIPLRFDFVACFVDTNFVRVNKDTLINYFKQQGITFYIKKLNLDENNLNCFWCSWNRRKVLFETAKEVGCNKIALGHHLDDITETILMNLCFFGEISAMKPKIELFNGELVLIRPLCYVEKKDLEIFARKLGLPFTHYECLYGRDSRRMAVKSIMKELEKNCAYVKKNIFGALKKVRESYLV
jgi:tRNA 2-thiocytidine biosynthesis protein TtcA